MQFVTGATGFVGGAITLELLTESSSDLLCLVRRRNDTPAGERLTSSLREAASIYGRDDLLPEIEGRCRAIEGDLSSLRDGIKELRGTRIDTLWHAAASLNFHDAARERTMQHNVDGTAAALRLAAELGAEHFVHVSTAYVAGTAVGTILEKPASEPAKANNPYEESKIKAERLVLSEQPFRTWIVRPGIVIGHSRTLATVSSAGLYGAIDGAIEYKRTGIAETLERPLRLIRSGDAPVSLIPIDAVAANTRRIRESDSEETIFHLTNGTPPTILDLTEVICEAVGNPMPEFVNSDEGFTPIERAVADHPEYRFQQPYLSAHRHFDLTHTDAAIGADASRYPLDSESLRRYVNWYLDNIGYSRPMV